MAPPSANPTPTGKQLIYGQLLNIELLNNIPYAEVVDRINGNLKIVNSHSKYTLLNEDSTISD